MSSSKTVSNISSARRIISSWDTPSPKEEEKEKEKEKEEQPVAAEKEEAEDTITGKLVNIEKVMEESLLWDFDEFAEQLELTLQFSWIMMFSSVFPLGSAVATLNNVLEMRSDTYKLSKVCQRPVPAVANGIGAWEGILEGIVKASVVVNVAITTISLNAFKLWEEDSNSEDHAGAADNWREVLLMIFIVISVSDVVLDTLVSFVPKTPTNVKNLLKARQKDLLSIYGSTKGEGGGDGNGGEEGAE